MTIRISMWSGPRNISTTMMRSFENRADTSVFDEPAYGLYLRASGADHPYGEETRAEWPADAVALARAMADETDTPIRFYKHIAYHTPDVADAEWLAGHRHFILIRDPRAMVRSFAAKLDDAEPIIESYRIACALRARLDGAGLACPVVDARDILNDPHHMLGALCDALDIPFDAAMLAWPAGPRPSDGPWAAHWYEAVNASTGFRPPAPPPGPLAPDLEQLAARAEGDYRALHAARLT